MTSHPVLVVGHHRSGTSLCAELVSRSGVRSGPAPDLLPANEHNRRGHFEFRPLVTFNNRLLTLTDATWVCPPDPDSVERLAHDSSLAEAARGLIDQMFADGHPWFWKDPRLCFTLPFWRHFLGDAVIVLTLRNPLDSAKSLQKRSGLTLTGGLCLWEVSMLRALGALSPTMSVHVVEYEALLTEPEPTFARLHAFLRRCLPGLPADAAASLSPGRAVDPALHHHSSKETLDGASRATPAQIRLYDQLRAVSRDELTLREVDTYPPSTTTLEYLALQSTAAEAQELKRRLHHLHGTVSYRLGRALTWLPRRLSERRRNRAG